MKINKNIYTQELDKAYTILKQQYIIIKCMLELVDSNNNYDDDLTNIKQTIQRVEQLIQSIEGDLNAVEYDIDLINNYINTINEYIAQNGNTTEIGGNLEVDGNGQVNGNLNINGNLTIDGEPLSVGSINVVREDSLGGFLNTVFRYQSKEDIPNELQTQANIQSLKQISRDTTAIIARYNSFDYVLQIDSLVGDTNVIGDIHGYLYNPYIKDVILVSIDTANSVATLNFNTDSGGSSESNIVENNSFISDLENALNSSTSVSRELTSDEQTLMMNILQNDVQFIHCKSLDTSTFMGIDIFLTKGVYVGNDIGYSMSFQGIYLDKILTLIFDLSTGSLVTQAFSLNNNSSGSSGETSNVYEASTEFSNFLLATETGETELPTSIVNEINNIPYNATGIFVDATSMGVPLKLFFVISSIATTNDWSIPAFFGKLVLYNFQTKGLMIFGYDNGTYKCIVS